MKYRSLKFFILNNLLKIKTKKKTRQKSIKMLFENTKRIRATTI